MMETRILHRKPNMKPNLLSKSLFIICAMIFATFSSARAQVTNSTWAGQPGDNWSDASKWNPALVPNNTGSQSFNVTVNTGAEFQGINVDIDVTLNSLSVTDQEIIPIVDHNLASGATDLGSFPDREFGGGAIIAIAQSSNVSVKLGNLANFSANKLTSGNYLALADVGRTSTIQFNGADIRTNNAAIQIAGPGAGLLDENGNDALRNIEHNLLNGQLANALFGHNFTTAGSLVNEGEMDIVTFSPFDQSPDLATTFTVSGDFTGIGFPDDGNLGFVDIEAPGADAKLLIKGALTNYDASHKTLGKMWNQWIAAAGHSAATQVLGGSKPLDIVTSQAALQLFGPNTGFRDKFGNDALRNLAVSARLLVGDRDFATVASFSCTNRLSIYGGSNFTVNGHLTINAGRFEVSSESGYAHVGGGPPHEKSNITVRGNLNVMSGVNCRFVIFDNATLSSVRIGGAAILNGVLQIRLLDGANITSSDTFTLLTAAKIVGRFSNVANGGHVIATSFSDGSELGTFLVTINKKSVVLSNFQPAP
jgi:hypothetical protein